jgi:hypothetical protein
MARLGGGSGGSSAPSSSSAALAPVPAGEDVERDEDGRELYEVLADQVGAMSTGQQLGLASALQRNSWTALTDEQRELFRLAAEEFLSEGGA